MVELFLLCLYGFVWWFFAGYIPSWNFHRRPVKEMSTKKLRDVNYHWFNGYAFQDKGEMFYIQKKYLKGARKGDNSIMIAAYKRVLEIQEELLRREQLNTEEWAIDYVNSLKREIEGTKKSLNLYRGNQTDPSRQILIPTTAKIVTNQPTSPQQRAPSIHPAHEALQTKEKKPPVKRKTTLFLESFEKYLLREGARPAICAMVKHMVKHPKNIPNQSSVRKEYLTRKLYEYMKQANQNEAEMFGELIEKLLTLAETDD